MNSTRLLSEEEIKEKQQLEDRIKSWNDGYFRTPLMLAAENGHIQCVRLMLKSGADVNQSSKIEVSFSILRITALMFAVREGHHLCVQMLIQAGADVNVNAQADVTRCPWLYRDIDAGFTPLYFAITEAHLDCLCTLIQAGADVNYDSESYQLKPEPLHTAIFLGMLAGAQQAKMLVIIDALLTAGAEVKPRNVQMAAENWRECLELLVNSGADVNGRDEFGGTALIVAVFRNHTECVNILVKAGADVNEKNRDGDTALTLAISKRHDDIVRILIEAGADVNQEGLHFADESLTTPLISAARTNSKFIPQLLRAGAKVDETCGDAKNAIYHLKNRVLYKQTTRLLFVAGESLWGWFSVPMCLRNICEELQMEEYLLHLQCLKTDINLMNIIRIAIRRHLLQLNNVNLFYRVSRLGLPTALANFLLHDVTLDDDDPGHELTDSDSGESDW